MRQVLTNRVILGHRETNSCVSARPHKQLSPSQLQINKCPRIKNTKMTKNPFVSIGFKQGKNEKKIDYYYLIHCPRTLERVT